MLSEHQEADLQPELVEEPDYFSTKPIAELSRKGFLLFISFFTALMLIVAQNVQLVRASYKLVELDKHVAELEKENQSLYIDIARLKSPEHIMNIATDQLGLVFPDAKYISTSL